MTALEYAAFGIIVGAELLGIACALCWFVSRRRDKDARDEWGQK